ncbi:hypothetical protein GCM10010365_28420 [Streptomyces poonensis]|uniref:Uncharacterized protein n=1 Tax=Streptomyces poonensis TaxID=68255 RepID=A0A918UH75_9ACTN|nr:hypothetical protein GCM10010365_28420 [Streptomyces poonensis]GLJ88531.1 hypothetical protein GCM10017589_11310 [Streptomyces poonensis]
MSRSISRPVTSRIMPHGTDSDPRAAGRGAGEPNVTPVTVSFDSGQTGEAPPRSDAGCTFNCLRPCALRVFAPETRGKRVSQA